jgi:hypothetical protein
MHTVKSLKNKKNLCYIFIQQKKFQKYVLTYILALITSLLKSRELGQYFKNYKKKLFCFLSISRVTTLYVRRTQDIKFFC